MKLPQIDRPRATRLAVAGIVCGLLVAAFVLRERWISLIPGRNLAQQPVARGQDADRGAHEHNHAGHSDQTSLHLSPEGARNIGLTTTRIELRGFERTISVPAMVVERPGRSQIDVTAPMGGRVTRIYAIEGEAVLPGQPLFDLRLTHEELVAAQSEFLRLSKELDVVQREIDRLKSVGVQGAIAGKTIRQREYEQEKLRAVFDAQQQSLLLHGLTREQIRGILESGELMQQMTIVAPPHPKNGHLHDEEHPFVVQSLTARQGEYLNAGESLCLLADHFELFIEGMAFQEDAKQLTRAATEGWDLRAVTAFKGSSRDVVKGLTIDYLADTVDPESRAFHFYVSVQNEIVRDVTKRGHRFVAWKFKPGQRMELRVPVELWENRIVLPVEAVVEEGPETFVFEQNGDHFDRRRVHVEYRGQDWAVIANDGKLLGATVATRGAYQMQLALKNQAGGGVDPHAGHNH